MMKFGNVVLIGFFVATALASGLLGFWLGTYQQVSVTGAGPATVEAPVGEPIRGNPVALTVETQVRLHAGTTLRGSIAYTIEGDNVWVGDDTTSQPVYILQGHRLMRSFNNEIQYTLSGSRIYRGSDTRRDAVYTISEHRVFSGDTVIGEALLTFVGNHVHWGSNAVGRTIMTANTDIEGNPTLEFLLPILLLERF
ncbi:MAG: hypothetical protein ACE5LU_03850 [Anaerolineae bacterium]